MLDVVTLVHWIRKVSKYLKCVHRNTPSAPLAEALLAPAAAVCEFADTARPPAHFRCNGQSTDLTNPSSPECPRPEWFPGFGSFSNLKIHCTHHLVHPCRNISAAEGNQCLDKDICHQIFSALFTTCQRDCTKKQLAIISIEQLFSKVLFHAIPPFCQISF